MSASSSEISLRLLVGAIAGASVPAVYVLVSVAIPACWMVGQDNPESGRERIVKALRNLIVVPVCVAAFMAPVRLLTHGITWVWPDIPVDTVAEAMGIRLFPWFDAWLGAWGVALSVGGGFVTWFRNLRMMRQMENLPTSTVRSAALGPAELRGVARTADREAPSTDPILLWFEPFSPQTGRRIEIMRPFHLEDETGRILVDPRGAPWWKESGPGFLAPVRGVQLIGRVEIKEGGVERRLMPGDPVYVIGNVEARGDAAPEAADAERLVVRPSSDWVTAGPLRRLFTNTALRTPGGDIHHVFFLADTDEVAATVLMSESVSFVWEASGLWAAASGCLLWMAWGAGQ